MQSTEFDDLGRFILDDYPAGKPFASFLPGIAGLDGIPLWAFYVNRGQCVAGFGVESRNHPIMEFQPANRAYQSTPLLGFRTFLKGRRDGRDWVHEPFSPWQAGAARRTLFTGLNELEIREVHPELGLQVDVLYFVLPGEPFAGLVRRVTFHNLGASRLSLEVLDGLPVLIPYGADELSLKQMGRTLEAWMEVTGHEDRLPFFRMKATHGDSPDVQTFAAGNFALACLDGERLPALVDPVAAFGMDTSLSFPGPLRTSGLAALLQAPQVCEGRSPCALFAAALDLAPGETKVLSGLYGHAPEPAAVAARAPALLVPEAVEEKLAAARQLALDLTDDIATASASPAFDAYCRQTYLDNLMRGGRPLVLGGKHVYHVYSRKHGDLERDYNHFFLAAEFYSQGDGNYRDVNQNRRSDVFFLPQAGEFNLRLFMSLIQADGYNPLVVEGTVFSLPPEGRTRVLELVSDPAPLDGLLAGNFTPGRLLAAAARAGLRVPPGEFLETVLSRAEQHVRAAHGEGYWCDHWTYNLDLVESFLSIYPDRKQALLFDSPPLPFYDSAHRVLPRRERFVLDGDRPRQYNAVVHDEEKAALIASRSGEAHWARDRGGQGEVFRLPLFSKLALLAVLKFAALDPSGFGIQMEGGRPGWYDALNGLPALFGSSMPETFELLRLVEFLVGSLEETPREVDLPLEAENLFGVVRSVLDEEAGPLESWERLSTALESYRVDTRLGFDGRTVRLDLAGILAAMRLRLQDGAARALALNGDFPPTYFVHAAAEYERLETSDARGCPHVRVKAFEARPLPAFLEGPVRQMKVLDREAAARLHARVRASELFDRKLGMYRVNASLQALSHEIGRARAFTPGWLENESIWMHMAFKYLLELLKAGLYEQFFADLPAGLPAFMDPGVYGRSPLENSSFIASSAHPDPSLHGNGFVARLSGSTAEFLSIWACMTAGRQPFRLEGGELILELQPALPSWLFREDGTFAFRFLGCCDVVYHNPSRRDTFAPGMVQERAVLRLLDGKQVTLDGGRLVSPYVHTLRDGQVEALEIIYR